MILKLDSDTYNQLLQEAKLLDIPSKALAAEIIKRFYFPDNQTSQEVIKKVNTYNGETQEDRL